MQVDRFSAEYFQHVRRNPIVEKSADEHIRIEVLRRLQAFRPAAQNWYFPHFDIVSTGDARGRPAWRKKRQAPVTVQVSGMRGPWVPKRGDLVSR
jgi:hypothetical protein